MKLTSPLTIRTAIVITRITLHPLPVHILLGGGGVLLLKAHCDMAVTQQTWRHGDLQRKVVLRLTNVEHVARVGRTRFRLGGGVHLRLGDAETGAVAGMEGHLALDIVDDGSCFGEVADGCALVASEGVGAGELDLAGLAKYGGLRGSELGGMRSIHMQTQYNPETSCKQDYSIAIAIGIGIQAISRDRL
jgi:hypothetical protein